MATPDSHASELTHRNRLLAQREGVYFSNDFSS